ncbi:AIPR family protein [Acinetobacter baumannii]|uniref:AIPR family protein n=3 Tax=Acinetobacter baumannii TaxID=470 RepID=UPI0003DF2A18|nr:AIPR family protein [Acinetobacter baumannii]EHU3229507.1 AIPR family protein [Acinetobacter baumannii]EJA9988836.1 AIPR family protein [Acinetobacter baumannii]EJC1498556.1 AIPR family protein [Acinetobacter baumannii]EJC8092745.1 AIPR family protein [Acinetobacter baumannii]EJG9675240.1 AIPR family protein [Acinetobacter baumannii]
MKDEILKNHLKLFSEKFGYSDLNESQQFEHFVNFNIISKLYPREIDIDSLSSGGSNDLGIDGVAIIINGNIVTNSDEIEHFRRMGSLDVEFILIQSKTSSKFSGEQIGTFIFGVKNLFDDKSSVIENAFMKNIRDLKDNIYSNTLDFDVNPELKLYFVTTGEWKEPEQITGRVNRELKDIYDKGIFRSIPKIEFYDAEKLKNSYKEISRKTIKEIKFNNHVALPDLPEKLNVRQSLIGSVSIKDYIKLISDEDDRLFKGLFYDNVRDYQGLNKVNKEINETLNDNSKKYLMPLLNNGITVIAKKVDKVGQKLKLTDFQIVNGCQSSHVLFDRKNDIDEDLHIIVKIIETNDQDVINSIIIATNKQTEVKDEAFESIKPFHRELDEYFKAKTDLVNDPIYYERRSKEYFNDPNVKNHQIVTLAYLVKSYVATVLAQPQSTHRYFGELIESNEKSIFKNNKNISDYYISALLCKKIDSLFRLGLLYESYKNYKYHLIYIIYSKFSIENKNNDEIIFILNEQDKLFWYAINACKIIAWTSKNNNMMNSMHNVRSKDFTLKLKDSLSSFVFK